MREGDVVVVKPGHQDPMGLFRAGDVCVVTKTYDSLVAGNDKFVAVLVLRTGHMDDGPRAVERFEVVRENRDT